MCHCCARLQTGSLCCAPVSRENSRRASRGFIVFLSAARERKSALGAGMLKSKFLRNLIKVKLRRAALAFYRLPRDILFCFFFSLPVRKAGVVARTRVFCCRGVAELRNVTSMLRFIEELAGLGVVVSLDFFENVSKPSVALKLAGVYPTMSQTDI